MNPMPLFIRLHSNGAEGMVNLWSINAIVPYNDTSTYVYLNCRDDAFLVHETYEEIKKKLLKHMPII